MCEHLAAAAKEGDGWEIKRQTIDKSYKMMNSEISFSRIRREVKVKGVVCKWQQIEET